MRKTIFMMAVALLATGCTGRKDGQTVAKEETEKRDFFVPFFVDDDEKDDVDEGREPTTGGKRSHVEYMFPTDTVTVDGTEYVLTGWDGEDDCRTIVGRRNGKVVKRCKVTGAKDCPELVDGDKVRFALGVEKYIVSLRGLPSSINLYDEFAPVPVRRFASNRTVRNDSGDVALRYISRAYAPMGLAAGRCINTIMKNTAGRSSKHVINYPMAPYQGNEENIQGMMDYYGNCYQTNYKKMFGVGNGDFSRRLYLISITPTWQQQSKKLMTFRVHENNYTGGAHGYFQVYYLSFDSRQKLLGWFDIFRMEKIPDVQRMLGKKIWAERGWLKPSDKDKPETGELSIKATDDLIINLERVRGKVFPRPALTEKGVVFSYQPYWIASFAEGDLHYVLTYDELEGMLKEDWKIEKLKD